MTGVVGAVLFTAAAVLAAPPRAAEVAARRLRGRGTRDSQAAGADVGLPAPVVLDLVRAALAAGLPTSVAVAAAFEVAGCRPGAQHPAFAPLDRALRLAERTGASAAVLIRQAALDQRAARRRRLAHDTGRLGVRLVLPLGLAILPAFVLLGVAPVVLGLAEQIVRSG